MIYNISYYIFFNPLKCKQIFSLLCPVLRYLFCSALAEKYGWKKLVKSPTTGNKIGIFPS